MYNSSDDKFPDSNNFSSLSLITKKFSPFVKAGFEINNFSQLPAIKEEEASSSEEESEKNTASIENIQSFTKFPSLNINCLMNIDVKQSHSIWNTKFGKRLINENTVCEVLSEPEFKETSVKKCSTKCKPSKTLIKTKFVLEGNGQNCKDKIAFGQNGSSRKKSKKISKENKNFIKESTIKEEISHEKNSLIIPEKKPSEKSAEIPKAVLLGETSSASLNPKPQFLTEYVKSIFEHHSNELKCEHCNETFSDTEKLCSHQKQHEVEKETCLLCEKVFYNSSKFVQHLLTHEGVDRFSCKKCMKYFPNLKKYKQHVQELHCKSPPTISYICPPKFEFVENWLPKFKCKRCKIEMDSAKTYEAHRRAHVRKDLEKAYFLSINNI